MLTIFPLDKPYFMADLHAVELNFTHIIAARNKGEKTREEITDSHALLNPGDTH